MSSASRRLLTALVTGALLLTSCGDDDATSESSAEATQAEEVEAGTRTVEHAMGTTEVPDDPERVVVLDSSFLDAALALDIEPVGATEAEAGAGMPEYLADEVPDIEVVGLTNEPNLEAVAALRPDLILGAKVRHEELYEELAGIAPTVFTESSGTNWKDGLAVTADALGRSEEADAFLADYESRAAGLGEKIGANGTHLSMVRFLLPDEIRIYGPETFSGTVLTDIGFDLGDHDWDEYSMAYVSAEQIGQADADVIFTTSYGGRDSDTFQTAFASIEPLWNAVPAVAEGNQHWVDDDTWMLGIGPLGAQLILDDVESVLGA
jgi:iron complex transport system substrate-binding protein